MLASRRSGILAVLLMGAAIWSPVAAGDCMLEFERSNVADRSLIADLPALTPTPEVSLVVAVSPVRQQGRISADCSKRDVFNVELRMMPGEQVRFYVLKDITKRLILDQESTALNSIRDWVRLRVLTSNTSLTVAPTPVAIRVPLEFEPGEVFETQLRFHRSDGDEGPIEVNLRLEVIEEGPLFRDGFGVDPVLGQFSFLEPAESPLDGQVNY